MPWFFLDTHERGRARFGWIGAGELRLFRYSGMTGGLAGAIAKRIPLNRLQEADGICTVSGPGSFSSIRTGILIANLLARVLQKPLVGVSAEAVRHMPRLGRDLAAGRYFPQAYVAPQYDQEPNITVSSPV